MRIRLDRNICTGHARCFAVAPDVFDADDDGYGIPRFEEVPTGLEELARRAANSCPERAITINP